jgi:hypothetical protein
VYTGAREEVFPARDAKFGSDDPEDCRSFGLDDSMFMEVVRMRNCPTQSAVVEGLRLPGSETTVVVLPKWIIFKIIVTSAIVATLIAEMCVTLGSTSSRMQ